MDFKFAQIFKTDNELLKSKVIKFWIDENCMSEKEAGKRINEALIAILDSDDNIVSVCSGKPYLVDSVRDWFLYYRTYTRPEYRNKDFAKALFVTVFDYFDNLDIRKIEGVDVKGIYVVFENDILNQSVTKFVTEKSRLTLIGFNEKNQQLRIAYFKNAELKK